MVLTANKPRQRDPRTGMINSVARKSKTNRYDLLSVTYLK